MSFRPMVFVDRGWYGNALRFATKEEAEEQVRDLMLRWTTVMDWRVDTSNDPVNYRYEEGRLYALQKKDD